MNDSEQFNLQRRRVLMGMGAAGVALAAALDAIDPALGLSGLSAEDVNR